MKYLYYNIHDFKWDTDNKIFYGEESSLYPIEPPHYYQLSFPNQRGQFYIKNMATGGFRRFRYMKEIVSTETDIKWRFESEDGILCDIQRQL